jgi:phospholipid/cholesterol/gamma-HCH transport system ATP-binding protein
VHAPTPPSPLDPPDPPEYLRTRDGTRRVPPPSTPSDVVEMEGVHKTFDGIDVLRGLDLRIRRRETLVIIGRSGSGKSVTLKHIVGLLAPDRGRVKVFDRDMTRLSHRELLETRLKIGYLFQSGALINWLTIRENVALPLLTHRKGIGRREVARRVQAKLELVELGDAGNKYPGDISGGMKKRAGLARAVILDPEIILYDEPTAGLDPVMASAINDMVIHTHEALGTTQVVVTHDMESAFRIADRIAMLYEGRIIAEGDPEDFRKSDDPIVQQFITGSSTGPITNGG